MYLIIGMNLVLVWEYTKISNAYGDWLSANQILISLGTDRQPVCAQNNRMAYINGENLIIDINTNASPNINF